MGPKKKDRDTDQQSSSSYKGVINNGRVDPIQADHELFLQAFESMNCINCVYNTIEKQ